MTTRSPWHANWIHDWHPEDEGFRARTVARTAYRNLWLSMFSEHIGFSIWTMWSVLVLFRDPAYHLDTASKFPLVSVSTVVGAMPRLSWTFAVTHFEEAVELKNIAARDEEAYPDNTLVHAQAAPSRTASGASRASGAPGGVANPGRAKARRRGERPGEELSDGTDQRVTAPAADARIRTAPGWRGHRHSRDPLPGLKTAGCGPDADAAELVRVVSATADTADPVDGSPWGAPGRCCAADSRPGCGLGARKPNTARITSGTARRDE